MRIIIWHGYLLGGTGSNVYTRSLARTWSRQGHDVVVVCQEPHPEQYDLGGARVVRPQLPGRLPVFVLDRYADATPVLLPESTPAERDAFVSVNADAIRSLLPADFVLVNHVLLGAPVGVAAGAPFLVKVHGSELEFAIRGHAELAAWAGTALAEARAVIAGSDHIAGVLEDVVGPGEHSDRVHVVPPGVDIDALRPQDRPTALASLLRECARDDADPTAGDDDRSPDPGNAARLAAFLREERPTVVYAGKLSKEKGVAVLLKALGRVDARAVMAGFGPEREALAAAADPQRVLFTGPLEHRHLAHLWALADASVTPSVFPEAFGMVAAEAAACGSPPLVANHSGLAEIATHLRRAYPPEHRHLASFKTADAVDLAEKLKHLLSLDRVDWSRLSAGARRTAVEHWSWTTVAERLVALAADADPDSYPGSV